MRSLRALATLLALGLVGACAPVAAASPSAASNAGSVPAAGAGTSAAAPAAAGSGLPPIVDPNAPFVLMADVFVVVPQGQSVHVEELVTGANRSTSVVHGLTFALPPGVASAAPESGIAAGAFEVNAQGAQLGIDVPPQGDVHAAFSFTMSWNGGRLWLPVSYPTGELTVMVPHGRWAATGPGFLPAGTLPLSGTVSVDAATTVTPTAGALLPVQLRPLQWWNRLWLRIALAAVSALLLALGVAREVRRRRGIRSRRAAELIDAVAELDLAHQRGDVGESPWVDRRRGLMEELETLHGR